MKIRLGLFVLGILFQIGFQSTSSIAEDGSSKMAFSGDSEAATNIKKDFKPDLSRIISIDLHEKLFSNFLRIISETTNMQVVQMDQGDFPISARSQKEPAENVLDSVLKEYRYEKRIAGNVIKVYPQNHPALRHSPKEKQYQGRLISLDLSDTDIDNALRILEEVSNKSIEGKKYLPKNAKVTFRLIDVPWDHVLDILLEREDLKADVNEQTIQIKPVT